MIHYLLKVSNKHIPEFENYCKSKAISVMEISGFPFDNKKVFRIEISETEELSMLLLTIPVAAHLDMRHKYT